MSALVSITQRQPIYAAGAMAFLWLIYTLVYTLPFNKDLEALLEALAGSLGVVVLLLLGFSRQELFLQLRRVSPRGLIALGIATLALAGPLSMSSWVGPAGCP